MLPKLLIIFIIGAAVVVVATINDNDNISIINNNNNNNDRPLNNLAFEGGGIRSISFIGALKALKTSQYYANGRFTFENLAGTSTGCLFAYMTALQIDPDAMEKMAYTNALFDNLMPVDRNSFNDIKMPNMSTWYSNWLDVYRLINKIIKLLENWSVHESPGLIDDALLLNFVNFTLLPFSPLRNTLNLQSTFSDLHALTNCKLTCVATQWTTGRAILLGYEHTPNMNIFDAVYASMSMPGIYKPLLDSVTKIPLFDGGLSYNFPIDLWDNNSEVNHQTLGLSLLGMPDNSILYTATAVKKQSMLLLSMTDGQEHRYAKIDTKSYFETIYELMINRSHATAQDRRIVWLESPLDIFDTNLDANAIGLAINRAYLNTISAAIFKDGVGGGGGGGSSTAIPNNAIVYNNEFQFYDDDYSNDID